MSGFRDVGSSPLARGLPGRAGDRLQPARIIPARAGFTEEEIVRPGSAPDHPRSRGVYGGHDLSPIVMVGSSPLARGLRRPQE